MIFDTLIIGGGVAGFKDLLKKELQKRNVSAFFFDVALPFAI